MNRREFIRLSVLSSISYTLGGLIMPSCSEALVTEYNVHKYINALISLNKTELGTEHTFRSALEDLINAVDNKFKAINEPKRQACGAPDYVILQNVAGIDYSIGYIEAKAIHISLDKSEKTEQFKCYSNSLDNLILTNYLEFRWFIKGELHKTLVLGILDKNNKLKFYEDKKEEFQIFIHDFLNLPIAPVKSAEELAERMARITHAIRAAVQSTLDSPHKANLEAWKNAFAETLLPSLKQNTSIAKAEFADMYAQTLAYGFFAARCFHDMSKNEFERLNAHESIPKTNPLLRSLFINLTGPDLKDEPYYQFVEDLIQLLRLTNMENVLKDFGKYNRRTDPVIHFYETFLSAYDPELRDKRGVYYTPEPIVSWLVRSADIVVRDTFGIPQGLADNSRSITETMDNGITKKIPKVLILDPACGTGTFLYETTALIRDRLKNQGQIGMWSAYVKESLLPRILGFELLMAPYSIAHFKLSMQLAGYDMPETEQTHWTYDFSSSERLQVYLTNTLENLEKSLYIGLPGLMKVLSDEGEAAREIKRDLPVLVIMGNPPYSGESANASWRKVGNRREMTFIGRLIEDYKKVDGQPLKERNPKFIQDDYVKFIRWAQYKIDMVQEGVITFVTNHGYLDNPTFRGMRQSLMQSFDEIYVYDLHGNARKKEKSPYGSPDENVFDIMQGIAMAIFIKRKNGDAKAPATIYYAETYGTRETKYEKLFASDINNISWKKVNPLSPNYIFKPQNADLAQEFHAGIAITDIFQIYSTGITSARDKLTVHFTPEEMWTTVQDFMSLPIDDVRKKFNLKDTSEWQIALAQEDIKKAKLDKKYLKKILYRPFDVRYTYYTGKSRGFISRPRSKVMKNMLNEDNIALITTRIFKENKFNHVQATRFINASVCMSTKTSTTGYIFPLYTYTDKNKNANIRQNILNKVNSIIDIKVKPEDIFYYIYAVLNSPSYQERYEFQLKYNFPRITFTQDPNTFYTLVNYGQELVKLHSLSHPILSGRAKWITTYPIASGSTYNNQVEKKYPKYKDKNVYINEKQYFGNVPPNIWEYNVGGYQVAEKWLKDRRGRKLSLEELDTYQQIILALSETIRIRQELNNAYNVH